MVYRIVLTQPLAAGPDGEWEYDLLMEGKPAADDLPLSESQRRIIEAANGGGRGDTGSSGEKKTAAGNVDDAEMTVSEDECVLKDNDIDNGVGNDGNEGGHHVDIDHGAATTSSKVFTGFETKSLGIGEDSLDCAGSDTETDVDLELGKNFNHNSDVSDVTNSDGGLSSGDSSAGARDIGRVCGPEAVNRADGSNGCSDLSLSAQCDPEDRTTLDAPDRSISEEESSVDMEESSSSVDMEEVDDDDSSFGESNEEYGASSEGGESEDGSDGFVPDVVPSICFMKHQNRPPHKDGLCKECYIDMVDRETRAGLRSANGAPPEAGRRKRPKRSANDAGKSKHGKVRAEETRYGHPGARTRNKSRKKRLKRRNDADTGKRSARDRRCRQDLSITRSDRTGFRGRRQRRNRVVTSDTDNEDDGSTVDTIEAKNNDGAGLGVLKRPKIGKCIDITSSSCEDSANNPRNSPPSRVLKVRRPPRADSDAALDTDAGIKAPSKLVAAGESNGGGRERRRTGELAKVNAANMVGDVLSMPVSKTWADASPPQVEESDSVRRHSCSRSDTTGIAADGEPAPSSPRSPRTEIQSWDANRPWEAAAEVGSDNPGEATGVGDSAVTPARAKAVSTTRHPDTNVAAGGDAESVEKRGMGSSSHDDHRIGKKARNGAVSCSAEKSNVAEYVELPREVGLQTSWRLSTNLGNANAPSHVETMGLTPLTAEPGSRIAKRIESGYVASFPPNAFTPTARKSITRPSSGAKAAKKQRRPKNSSASAAASGELSSRTAAATKRGQQITSAPAEASRTPRPSLPPGKHGDVSATPIDNSVNGPRKIDLPMRKGNLESTPSYSPRVDTKIWWPNKLFTSDQPPDGRYLPSLPSAVPLRSALKGGRQAALAQPPTTENRPLAACTDTTPAHGRVYNLHHILGDNYGDTAEATAPRVETTTSSMLCPVGSDDPSRENSVPAVSGSPLGRAAMSTSESGETCVPSCGPAVMASGKVSVTGAASGDHCTHADGDGATSNGDAVAQNDEVSSEKRRASGTAEKPGDSSPDRSSRKAYSGLGGVSVTSTKTFPQRDIVPLRDHLAQMRNRAAAQNASGAEASGQQAMSRWMHAKNDDSLSPGDAGNGDYAGNQANASSSASRLSVPISLDEHVQVASTGPVASQDASDAASSSGSDSSIDEDLEDLEEYEKLGEKLVELKRDVGASSLLPPTADSAAQSPDEHLELSSPAVGSDSVPSTDSLLRHANAVAVPSRTVEDSNQGSQPAPGAADDHSSQRRWYDETYEACPKTCANNDDREKGGSVASPSLPHVAPPEARTSGADAVAMVAEDPVAPWVPLASPVGEETEDVVTEETPEVMGPSPPVPTVRSTLLPRVSCTDQNRMAEEDGAEVERRGEPPPVPRVPWKPPAKLSRANSVGDTASAQSAVSPPPGDASSAPSVGAQQPSQVKWVTPRALENSAQSSVAALTDVRWSDDLQAPDHGAVTISPSSGHSEETQNEGSQPARGQEEAQSEKNSNPSTATTILPVAVSTEQQKQSDHDDTGGATSHSRPVKHQRGNKRLNRGKLGGVGKVGVHTTAGASNAPTREENTEVRSANSSDDTRRSESSHGSHRGDRDHGRQSSRRCHEHRRRSPDRSTGRRSPDRDDGYWRRSASRSPGRSSRRGSRGRDEDTYYRRRERSYANFAERDRDGYRRRHDSCDRSRRDSRDEDEDIRRDLWVTRTRSERSPSRRGYSEGRSRRHRRSRSR